MKTIYIGEVRKASIKELNSENGKEVTIDDKTSENNVFFYKNVFGVIVRIDNGHVYFSRNGAYGYLYNAIKEQGANCTVLKSCEYINQATFVPKTITNKEFKTLKKQL